VSNEAGANPRVSNGNWLSASCLKSIQYQHERPGRIHTLARVQRWSIAYSDWYAKRRRHSGLALFLPADVSFGRVAELAHSLQRVLDAAYAAQAERFVHGGPTVRPPAGKVATVPPDSGSVTPSVADALRRLQPWRRLPPACGHRHPPRPCRPAYARPYVRLVELYIDFALHAVHLR
jgi:hypothetical protein